MINIELNDMLVFEDESGNIYRDFVYDIGINLGTHKVNEIDCSQIKVYLNTASDIDSIVDRFGKNTYKLKEIWHKTDEDTYKKVAEAELVDGKLTTISYINGMKVYHKRQEITYEQIKDFVVKE